MSTIGRATFATHIFILFVLVQEVNSLLIAVVYCQSVISILL